VSFNWKEGLKRLGWVLASVWWIGGLILFIIWFAGGEFGYNNETEWEGIFVYLAFWVPPPLIVWGIWKTGAWIIEGFKEDKPPIIEEKDSTEGKEK